MASSQSVEDCIFGLSDPIPDPISINSTHLLTPHPVSCLNTTIFANGSVVHLQYLDACVSTLSITCYDEPSRCDLLCDEDRNISLSVTVFSDALTVTATTSSCIEQSFSSNGNAPHLTVTCPDTMDLWSGSYNNGEWTLSLADNYNDITVKQRGNDEKYRGRVQQYKSLDGWVEFETTWFFTYRTGFLYWYRRYIYWTQGILSSVFCHHFSPCFLCIKIR